MVDVDITHDGMDFTVRFYDREDYEPYGIFTDTFLNGKPVLLDVTHNFTDEAQAAIYSAAAYEDRTYTHDH